MFRARFGYGQVLPWMRRIDGLRGGRGGPGLGLAVHPVTLTGRAFQHQATFTVEAGERAPFVLTWNPSLRGHTRAD